MKTILRLLTATIVSSALAMGSAHATTTLFGPGTFTFIAPVSGTYDFDLQGAQGGDPFEASGGLGAEISGLFNLSAGEQIGISVGGKGYFQGTNAGGGGGSFIYSILTNTLLLAAGGGGGGSTDRGDGFPGNGLNASTISSPLTFVNGTVDGVNGQNGFCCGSFSHVGTGGLSYLNTSSADGYAGNGAITQASTGGDGFASIISPSAAVPEPETWALMIVGFAAVGGTLRQRRHRNTISFA